MKQITNCGHGQVFFLKKPPCMLSMIVSVIMEGVELGSIPESKSQVKFKNRIGNRRSSLYIFIVANWCVR